MAPIRAPSLAARNLAASSAPVGADGQLQEDQICCQGLYSIGRSNPAAHIAAATPVLAGKSLEISSYRKKSANQLFKT